MDLRMTVEEREAFFGGLLVGVMSVERAHGPPLAVPVWYDYEPGGEVIVMIGADSLKQRLLATAGRFSLCAQEETPPYKYVSVEGSVSATVDGDLESERSTARRYLGNELGDSYVKSIAVSAASNRVSMRPERWFSVDYSGRG